MVARTVTTRFLQIATLEGGSIVGLDTKGELWILEPKVDSGGWWKWEQLPMPGHSNANLTTFQTLDALQDEMREETDSLEIGASALQEIQRHDGE